MTSQESYLDASKLKGWSATPPRVQGRYVLGSHSIRLYRKPSAWHRFWMRALLGWEWNDV